MKITRKEPQLLFSLPRFIHRLQREFPEKERSILEKRLYNMQAGYSGEKKVDDYLTLIPNLKSTIILTDVRLPLNSGSSFQIDTLIIAPQYILILEVKNIKDNLSFITNPHYLLRELDGNESSIECPITQLTLAKMN